MAKIDPNTFDFDTSMLDVFTEALETLLNSYDEARITTESFTGGVRDLIELTKKVPRSVTVTIGESDE